jgi:hypothetical protein|eukprot:COSAG01_NODE_6101_length_3849_cov_17.876533_4_plen_67_part_00
MMLRQAHSISWVVLEGTFCGSEALCVTEKVALARWDVSWPSAMNSESEKKPKGDENHGIRLLEYFL